LRFPVLPPTLAVEWHVMNIDRFEKQRQQMIAAMRVVAPHLADEIGEAALDDRALSDGESAQTRVCAN
jgi:hypothetical protein